jgi:hypothetical protein
MSDIFTSDNSVMLLIDHQVGTMQLIKTGLTQLSHVIAWIKLDQGH